MISAETTISATANVQHAIKASTSTTVHVLPLILLVFRSPTLDVELGIGTIKFALLAQPTGYSSTMFVFLSVINAPLSTQQQETVLLVTKDTTLIKEGVSLLT